ncbi:MAG: hypothetical protein QOJ42_3268 [Acidobacteriaceae bacterium]|nr:hypothetical protein [Acidobacteriaceae bacterium]
MFPVQCVTRVLVHSLRETQIAYFFYNSLSLDLGRSDCEHKEEAY